MGTPNWIQYFHNIRLLEQCILNIYSIFRNRIIPECNSYEIIQLSLRQVSTCAIVEKPKTPRNSIRVRGKRNLVVCIFTESIAFRHSSSNISSASAEHDHHQQQSSNIFTMPHLCSLSRLQSTQQRSRRSNQLSFGSVLERSQRSVQSIAKFEANRSHRR